ncbi:MAG: GNAT family N-acetyltransferase [bacterium]
MCIANMVQLVDPTTDLEQEYRAMIAEFVQNGEPDSYYRLPGDDFALFVAQLKCEARGEGLPDWAVPQNTLWAVRDGRMVGVLKLRHHLTPALENRGGHIGYFVRPSARGQGCATQMLAHALDKVRTLGLTRVLLTCNLDNYASARVMVKNGAMRDSDSIHPETGMAHARYWIDLELK